MDLLAGCAFRAHVGDLPDPRIERCKRHGLLDVVTVALCGVIRGTDTWVDVAEFGRSKEPWLRTFLALPNGIPSHDTLGRVFAVLDPAAFEAAVLGWVRALAATTAGQIVAIDGKTLRRSHDRATGKGPLHLVSAWASANRLVRGQTAVDTNRRCWATDEPAVPRGLDPDRAWAGMRSIALVEAERRVNGVAEQETRSYLSSLPGEARVIAAAVCSHWTIENQVHWAPGRRHAAIPDPTQRRRPKVRPGRHAPGRRRQRRHPSRSRRRPDPHGADLRGGSRGIET